MVFLLLLFKLILTRWLFSFPDFNCVYLLKHCTTEPFRWVGLSLNNKHDNSTKTKRETSYNPQVYRLVVICYADDSKVFASFLMLDCALEQLADALLSYDNQDDLAETLSVVPSRSILIQVRNVYLNTVCFRFVSMKIKQTKFMFKSVYM